MIGARELFDSMTKLDLELHVEFGVDTKHAMKGFGIVIFCLELGGRLEEKDVLWILELRWNFLLVFMIEKKGFCVAFHGGQALIRPMGSIFNGGHIIGIRERNLYRLEG